MAENKLKNYIPLGAPATRRPYEGDEPFLRVSLGFCPGWLSARLGSDFGEAWHRDPLRRYESLVKIKRYLHGLFPDVPEFAPRTVGAGAEADCATLSGVFGIKVIAMFYGQKIQFRPDGWPDSVPGEPMEPRQIASLPPFDLDSSPEMQELERQIDILSENFGTAEGYLNYQGVLNTAFALCGSNIFYEMIDDPGCARAAFDHVADTMLRVAKRVQARQHAAGFDIDLLSVSNCVMNMISPDTYRELLLPCDLMLSKQFPRFGVHTCNWNVTPYLDVLSNIKNMGYLDMGTMSDMRRAREVFPDARRAVLYSPLWIADKSEAEIRADVARIGRELGPCDIVLADVSDKTDEKYVRRFLDIASEFRA